MKLKISILILTILSLTISCKNKNSLKLTELKFADFEKYKIADNNIDTTLIISKNKIFFERRNLSTIGFNVYDKTGNLLVERRIHANNFWKFYYSRYSLWGTGYDIRYNYDNLGYAIKKDYFTDCSCKFEVNYEFKPSRNLLKQLWIKHWEENEYIPLDTSIFKFDKSGKLIESIEYENNDLGRGKQFQTNYQYNMSGQLIIKTINLIITKEKQLQYQKTRDSLRFRNKNKYDYDIEPLTTKNITNYYYSNNKIDSCVTKYYYPFEPKFNYQSKTYYDNKGLRTKTIEMDTIVITYIHKTRKDNKKKLNGR